jgi:hypothetical protein
MFKKLLLVSLVFATINLHAQTVEEIIAKNVEAMGGAAKIVTLISAKKAGTINTQGQDFPITFTTVHQKGIRIDFEVMGTLNYYLANAEKGYIFMPISQMKKPKEMDTEKYISFAKQLDLQGVFMNYKERGIKIELAGTEKMNDMQVDKLKVTLKDGKLLDYFIDKKTSRVVKTIGMNRTSNGADVEVETLFSDYKQNADGYWFAYATTSTNGPITFETIETNIKIDESIFKP